jgi:uncharacterized protein (DUF2141 family)
MKGNFLYIIFLVLFSLSFIDCAKRGNPEGGPRDTIPPVIVRSIPENYSTQFKGNEIRIHFDEYIKLKNLQQQLIISPPLENQPTIEPFSTARFIRIVFNDTLRANTTYSINFGNSIVDNNEENPFEFFKYVLSTGSYIDSLKVLGSISDAKRIQAEENVTVMLYEVDENYTDSIIFKKKPYYVANTQRNPGFFSIENIKEGKYLLIALKDNNNNYTFEPKVDKIGFVEGFVNVPADTTFHLTLFKEIPKYKFVRASALNSQKIQFGFEGKSDSIKIELLSETPEDFRHTILREPKKDTLYYWFNQKFERDSLLFKVTNLDVVDTVQVRLSRAPVDSLSLSALKTGAIAFDELIEIGANTPIKTVLKEKIEVIDKDSTAVNFNLQVNSLHNIISLDFEKEERQAYTITFFPEAVTDFFGVVNDTVVFRSSTRTLADYGFLTFSIVNPKSYPILVQLVTEGGDMRKEQYAQNGETSFYFENITPGNYYVRIIYDENENGKWDTGNFLKRRQPEEVVYFPKLLDIRANWTLNETFVLE